MLGAKGSEHAETTTPTAIHRAMLQTRTHHSYHS
jgi:hypothetical protein